MKKTAALLLAFVLLLGMFAAAENDDFIPAAPEDDPIIETTAQPSPEPTDEPTAEPSSEPTVEPTVEPSPEPTSPESDFPKEIVSDEYVVRAGLFYGNQSLTAANLENEVGEGYLFGKFTARDKFIAYGTTARDQITMQSDKTYHVQSGYPCATFEEAQATAAAVKEGGHASFPAYINGEWRVRVGSYSSKDDARAAQSSLNLPDSTVVGGSSTTYTVTVTPTGEVIFEYDDGGDSFGVMPIGADMPVTWHRGYKWCGGFEYRLQSNGRVSVINVVEIGDYTKGVIPYEIGTAWTEEGTKVGAICASSFAVYNANRHKQYGFDVCNTDHCQVYQGLNRATDFTNACCDAVADKAMFYNGKICNTVYHSTNGGSTEDAKNVWGSDVPYLKAVEDTYEDLDKAFHGRWSFTYTGEEISWILTQKSAPIGTVVKAWVDLTEAGNVYRVNFEDATGKRRSFEQERARSILGSDTLGKYTYSQRYTITKGGELSIAAGESGETVSASSVKVIGADGRITTLSSSSEVYVLTASGTDTLSGGNEGSGFLVSGAGWGHNVGLSQWGSRGRAEAGWNYKDILEYYYTGAKVMDIREVMG